jgi:hypothetical protein
MCNVQRERSFRSRRVILHITFAKERSALGKGKPCHIPRKSVCPNFPGTELEKNDYLHLFVGGNIGRLDVYHAGTWGPVVASAKNYKLHIVAHSCTMFVDFASWKQHSPSSLPTSLGFRVLIVD